MKAVWQRYFAKAIGSRFAEVGDQRTTILCYHSVHPTIPFAIRPEVFESHLAWLSANCEIIPFRAVLAAKNETQTRPRVAITFDDGYRDNYEIALPLLIKYRLTATFFVTTGFLLSDKSVVERLAIGWKVRNSSVVPMTWRHVRELQLSGMELGAHTCNHMVLAQLDRAVTAELSFSKMMLEDKLGTTVSIMSYPYGRPKSAVVRETIQLASHAGYERAALVLSRGVRNDDSLLELPRFIADNDPVSILRQKVLGWWDLMGMLREYRTPSYGRKY